MIKTELETAMTNFFCDLLKYYKSQNEVATILSVDKSYISRLKSGQIKVQLAQIYALCEPLEKSFKIHTTNPITIELCEPSIS